MLELNHKSLSIREQSRLLAINRSDFYYKNRINNDTEIANLIRDLYLALIFNTDQGSQFTSNEFVEVLLKSGIKISMDHKGRCFDNIFVERLWRTLKQESIYYYRPETVLELEQCLEEFVDWYNNRRLHQSLNYRTPKSVYKELKLIH